MMTFKPISTELLSHFIDDSNHKIIDTRSSDAFNGWKCRNEVRGGHIKNAVSLPASWLDYDNFSDIVHSKHILPKNNLVIYGYNDTDIQSVAEWFLEKGYRNITIYNDFVNEWSANPKLPMEQLPRYKHLVSAPWVKDLIDGKQPAEYNNNRFVVVHAHYRNREAYLSGHIPNAIDMDTLALETPETWNRRSPEELKIALENHGITTDTTVVLYGKFLKPNNEDPFPGSAAGHIGAIRLAMIMMYAGVKDVRVLNGGFLSWENENYEIAYDDVSKKPVTDFGAKIPARPEIIVDIEQAKQMLQSKDAELVSVRSWEEFIGNVSGYNYIEKKGRIPGAIFGNCGTDAYHMQNYRNVDHTVREAHEVAANWYEAGVTPDKHLAFYCGTGWRGSEAWFNAWLMGWPRVSVFDGGWFEWSNDPENPYETGIPNLVNQS